MSSPVESKRFQQSLLSAKKKAPVNRSFFHSFKEFRLERADVLSLQTLGTLRHLKLDALTFLQAAESASLNGRKMHENIFATLTADKAIALGVVKPLHCSLFHCVLNYLSVKFTLEGVGGYCRAGTSLCCMLLTTDSDQTRISR